MSIEVAILGASGVVGQKVIALLQKSHQFKISELIASEKRIGLEYQETITWREPLSPLSPKISKIKLKNWTEIESKFVISCLPGPIGLKIEPKLREMGKIIFSNSAAARLEENVPLLIPEINPDHLTLLNSQPGMGKIITNPNCVATPVALAIAPLLTIGEIKHVSIVTLQSASGAGFPGISSMDLLGNSIPHIEGEVAKITNEVRKILGKPRKPLDLKITTHVHRVPILYGHTVTLHIMFKNNIKREEVLESYKDWNKRYPNLFVLHEKNNRPQVNLDLTHDDMRIHIGNLRLGDGLNILGLVVLSHNLVRGAAGAVISNMKTYLESTQEVL